MFTKEKITKAVKDSLSIADATRTLFSTDIISGHQRLKVRQWISEYNLDTSHFAPWMVAGEKQRKWKRVTKVCPVCEDEFVAREGHPKEKVTCSHGCSNSYFRKGMEYNTSKTTHYRTICFQHHDKKCVVCGESNIVAVHHFDGDNKNNSPENLIPLCPTHHGYWHSRHRKLIKEVVVKYRQEFIEFQKGLDNGNV